MLKVSNPLLLVLTYLSILWAGQESLVEYSKTEKQRKLEVEYSKVNDKWVEKNKIKYIYDHSGNLIEKRSSIFNNSSWTEHFAIYSFYEDKNLIYQRNKILKNGSWKDLQSSTYTYKDQVISKRIDSTFMPQRVIHHSYNYNSEGFLMEELGVVSGDSVVNFSRLLHSYNTSNLVSEKRWQNFKDNQWVDTRRMLFEYDQEGNHIRTLKHNYKNGSWVGFMDYFLTVDNEGSRTDALWKIYRDSSWQEFKKVKYYY